MANLQNNPQDFVNFLGVLFGNQSNPIQGVLDFAVKLEEEEEKLRNRDALKRTVCELTRLYELGRLSKENYLKALDAILEEKQPKNITADAEIADRLSRLMNL